MRETLNRFPVAGCILDEFVVYIFLNFYLSKQDRVGSHKANGFLQAFASGVLQELCANERYLNENSHNYCENSCFL